MKPRALMERPAEIPENYHKNARLTPHQARRRRAVRKMLEGLTGRVLDYGCGFGDLTYAVSEGRELVGVDVDPARIAFAEKEYAPIPFHVCGEGPLDFPDGSFDIVLSVVVIHFTPDPLAYLREARRLLRENGHLLLVIKNRSKVNAVLRSWIGLPPRPPATWSPPTGERRPLWLVWPDECRGILEREGFSIVAQDCFYDTPFEPLGSWKEIPERIITQTLSLGNFPQTAGYFLFLARKKSSAAG